MSVERDTRRIQRLDPTRPVEWGEPLGYVTDDRDASDERLTILWVMHGANGDYYVTTTGWRERPFRGVRLCTSGGASSHLSALTAGASAMYRGLIEQARREFAST